MADKPSKPWPYTEVTTTRTIHRGEKNRMVITVQENNDDGKRVMYISKQWLSDDGTWRNKSKSGFMVFGTECDDFESGVIDANKVVNGGDATPTASSKEPF